MEWTNQDSTHTTKTGETEAINMVKCTTCKNLIVDHEIYYCEYLKATLTADVVFSMQTKSLACEGFTPTKPKKEAWHIRKNEISIKKELNREQEFLEEKADNILSEVIDFYKHLARIELFKEIAERAKWLWIQSLYAVIS